MLYWLFLGDFTVCSLVSLCFLGCPRLEGDKAVKAELVDGDLEDLSYAKVVFLRAIITSSLQHLRGNAGP